MSTKRKRVAVSKLAYTIPELEKLSSISRSVLYLEIKAGNLLVRKVRNRSIIRHRDAQAWLKALPGYQPKAKKEDNNHEPQQ